MRGFRPRGRASSTNMRPTCPDFDVLVAGAGPAGIALAVRLHRLGHSVLLAAPSPRSAHDLETLSPASQDQLDLLGLGAAVERARSRSVAFETSWGQEAFASRTPALLVDRRAFHAALRRVATEAGVALWDGIVEAPEPCEAGWRARLVSPQGSKETIARAFADAAGRRSLTPSHRRRGPPLIAIHAIMSGEDLPIMIRVAAFRDGWAWGAPMPDGRYVTTVFADSRRAWSARKAPIERVRAAIAQSGLIEGASHSPALQISGASDATPHVSVACEGCSFFRVGDAALALDPLSSSGVQTALQSAVDTGLAIHTLRFDPDAAALAEAFVSRRLERRRVRHASWAAAFYREAAARFPSSFWAERAREAAPPNPAPEPALLPVPDVPVTLDPLVEIAPEPCAVGDVIAWRPAVHHPGLTEPVTFVEGIELSGLLSQLRSGSPAHAVLQAWRGDVGERVAIRIFSWAWRNRLIMPRDQAHSCDGQG
jgi:flavin-dependent dehydrogenase